MRAILGALLLALVFWSGGTPAEAQDSRKDFFREGIASEAITFEAQLDRKTPDTTKSTADLQREARALTRRNDHRGALPLYRQAALAAPDTAGVWVELSIAALKVQSNQWRERQELERGAVSAAWLGYLRATTPNGEAVALAQLGKALARREMWRPALDATRTSLELRDDATLRATYDQWRAQHGFRILDIAVDSDAPSPRACIRFSEQLAKGRVDFAPYVVLDGGTAPALSAENEQLCLEGLEHGRSYRVTVRSGLPSAVEEPLGRTSELSIFVRDRSPQVRFTGRSYVLPRTGQNGIPVISVNTDVVEAEILRINDRNLARTVAGSDFRNPVTGYELDRMAEDTGSRVWTGEMPVDRRLNEEVTTALPVREAVGELQPGVYVMTAWPKDHKPERWTAIPTQWFIVSDLGLTAWSGPDGVHAMVRSLATAEPVAGAEVRFIARNNEILGTATTDDAGAVHFDPGLSRGEGGLRPGLIAASTAAGDFAFLSLTAPPFDLTDRGVTGREPPGPLDAYLFPERGVYRPGETVHLTALLRNAAGAAAMDVPLTIVVERPDGVEYRRVVVDDQGAGGRTLDVPLLGSVRTGSWTAKAYADPKGEPVGETAFLVEDFLPERLELTLSAAESISAGETVPVSVEGRWLYGAPAAGLAVEGEVQVMADDDGRPAFPGYRFGLTDEQFPPVRRPLAATMKTDAQGRASVPVVLPAIPDTTRLLKAGITVRLREPGGRAIERTVEIPVRARKPLIGVKPLFSGDRVGSGDTPAFEVIALDENAERRAREGLVWELYEIETRWQWYNRGSSWQYEKVTASRKVRDGRFDVAADAPARLEIPVTERGRFRLDVRAPNGQRTATSIVFRAGSVVSVSAETPDGLDISLDKEDYRTGETMTVRLSPRAAGKAHVAVYGDRLLASKNVDVDADGGSVTFPVEEGWGSGVYVVATHLRPLDTEAGRMPQRALGVAWAAINRGARTLDVSMTPPAEALPRTDLTVPLRIEGLVPGEEARVVVAAVDAGILSLTGYDPPAPEAWFSGQQALAAEIRDLYGQLIDGMRADRGAIRSGGDASGPSIQGSPPPEAPVALFSGIVEVAEDGTARTTFVLPAFNGTLKVMAVAWSESKTGHAVKDVLVRDPVVMTGAAPRFLSVGDMSRLRIDLDNVAGPEGAYNVSLGFEGGISTAGPLGRSIDLVRGRRTGVEFPLRAIGAGDAKVTVTLSAPDGAVSQRTYGIPIAPRVPETTNRSVRTLAAGGTLSLTSDLFAGLVHGTGRAAVSIGPAAEFDVPTLIRSLNTYPYGCSEQLTSRALPLLYLSELGKAGEIVMESGAGDRVQKAIDRLLTKQDSSGSFGLWRAGGADVWLTAYVTDFLTRARDRGYKVPDLALRLALDRLRNHVSTAPEVSEQNGGADLAYALYVLARNGRALAGDLRYFVDAKLDRFGSALSKAHLGAALSMIGESGRAGKAFAAAIDDFESRDPNTVSRDSYGSRLRDGAAILTLAAETGIARDEIPDLAATITARRREIRYTSTQEEAWMVMAARSLIEESARVDLQVDGRPHEGALVRIVRPEDLGTGGFQVANRGDTPLRAMVTVTGNPQEPEPPMERGFTIERRYYTPDGQSVDPARLQQNDRLVVVLKVTEPEVVPGKLLLVDRLPGGLEVENPRLLDSAAVSSLGWLPKNAPTAHVEFRDDRFVAAFDREKGNDVTFQVAYMVRVVTPGRYTLPPAKIEDMYRPERFARTAQGIVEVVE